MCKRAWETLRECADILHDVSEQLDADKMSTGDLDDAMDAANDIEADVAVVFSKLEVARWSRPECWRGSLRDDKPLYDAAEATGLFKRVQLVTGTTPEPWTGYLFTLQDDEKPYVMREFHPPSSTRDVVRSEEAHTTRRKRGTDSVFDDRRTIEAVARDLGMSVHQYLTEQTGEPKHLAAAMCFI